MHRENGRAGGSIPPLFAKSRGSSFGRAIVFQAIGGEFDPRSLLTYIKRKNKEEMLLSYYLVCVVYCFYQLNKTYRNNYMPGGLGISPGMDAFMVLIIGWILAPVDFSLRLRTKYKECRERD